ncbi:MAG: hypothetical protein PHD37_02025 [Gallionellaceae bacterium]|nr:hypothetical protein [Gallionellaceae bacterium]
MSGKVLLDLNLPEFQDDLLALDGNEVRLVLKTLRKLRGMDWPTVYRDHSLKWEEIKGAPGRHTLRLSRSCRAVARREGDYLRFIALHSDHDGAYGKK